VHLPREGMELFALEEPAPHLPLKCGVGQIIENQEGVVDPPELTDGSVEVVVRATGEQALVADRGSRMTGGKGGEKLAHPVPVGDDPVQVKGPLLVADDQGQRPIVPVGIGSVLI
jgi:hypothetical protein